MAGFSSLDNMITNITTNGKSWRADWNKILLAGNQAAGIWYCHATATGNPGQSAMMLAGGANLTFNSMTQETLGTGAQISGGIYHGGNVGAAGDGFKQIMNASVYSSVAASAPTVWMLVDVLGFYTLTGPTVTTEQVFVNGVTATFANATEVVTHTGIDFQPYTKVRLTNSGGAVPAGLALLTDYWTIRQSASTSKLASSFANAIAGTAIDFTTDGTGTNTITARLPRYSDGAGVQCCLSPSVTMGAMTGTMTLKYANSAATPATGKLTPAPLPLITTGAALSSISHSGSGAQKFGPGIPLAAGDSGISMATTVTFSSTQTSGIVNNVILFKPLLTLPLTTVAVAAERDCLNQIASLPRVYDGACLMWMNYAGATHTAATNYFGHIDFGWS